MKLLLLTGAVGGGVAVSRVSNKKMSQCMTKPTKWHVRPAETLISLGIHPILSESLLCTQWVAKDPSFLYADSKYSDQIVWMPRLI